jgi:hypothetical protein
MRVSVSGVFFFLVLFLVSYNGTLLFVTPLLLLLPVSLSVYRRWVDYILALWYHLGPVSFPCRIQLFFLETDVYSFSSPFPPYTQLPVSQALLGKSLHPDAP